MVITRTLILILTALMLSACTAETEIQGDDTGSTAQDTTTTTGDTSNSEDTGTEDTSSAGDTGEEDTTPELDTGSVEDATSEDTTAQDSAEQDTSAGDTTTQDTTAQDTAAQDTSSQDTAAQDTAPQDTAEDTGGPSLDYPADDIALCEAVNAYRVENGLPEVPISPALMAVARAHVEDSPTYFASNPPSECNLHSWSDNTPTWTGCCYTSDHAQADCMWRKGREITADWSMPFTGNGYENSAVSSSVQGAVNAWKGSPGHNNVILNKDIWANYPWKSIGCGADPGSRYFHLWFSDSVDPNTP